MKNITDFAGKSFGENEIVKIDDAHCYLIYGLILSHKPSNILELGIGSGKTTDLIINAVNYNQNKANITVVDNWYDFNFIEPPEARVKYGSLVNLINSSEKDYVFNCKEKYDFILSDADHFNTEKWFEHVYSNLLVQDGILIYHDVTNASFPNLKSILDKCILNKLNYQLFNQNTLVNERCDRGLLIIKK